MTVTSVYYNIHSPDPNPKQHLWDEVEWDVHSMNVWSKNLQKLCDAIESAWTKIPKESFQHLVKFMPHRLQAVLEANGSPTLGDRCT